MPSFGGLPNVTSPDPLRSDQEVILDLGWLIGWVGFSTAGTFPVSRALCFGSVTLSKVDTIGSGNFLLQWSKNYSFVVASCRALCSGYEFNIY